MSVLHRYSVTVKLPPDYSHSINIGEILYSFSLKTLCGNRYVEGVRLFSESPERALDTVLKVFGLPTELVDTEAKDGEIPDCRVFHHYAEGGVGAMREFDYAKTAEE